MSMRGEFDETLSLVTTERGSIYGHPLDDFGMVAKMKAAIAHCPDREVRHALGMILTKVARLCTTPDHVDSLIDIAGYARAITMIHDERRERQNGKSRNEYVIYADEKGIPKNSPQPRAEGPTGKGYTLHEEGSPIPLVLTEKALEEAHRLQKEKYAALEDTARYPSDFRSSAGGPASGKAEDIRRPEDGGRGEAS
jgi:hypothetical protein